MTAPQPATPGSDSVRAQIAEALAKLLEFDDNTRYYDHPPAVPTAARKYADVLVPLVNILRAEAKAEALEEFADKWARWVFADAPQTRGGASYRARAEAAAYRTNPSSEEQS